MQALLFIAIFSLFLSVATSITVGSGYSTQQITQQRIAEEEAFFKNISIVINDITRNAFQASDPSVTDPIDLIRSSTSLAQLASGRWSDPTLDPWGNQVTGLMAREYRVLYNAAGSTVVAPVTAFALISPGPNRKAETTLPSGTPTIGSVQNIAAGGDDIVLAFTDEPAQHENWEVIQHHMDRIALAETRYYQVNSFQYRSQLMTKYLQAVQSDAVTTPPDINDMMKNDPGAPQFLDLNTDNNRRFLGIDDDFAAIERQLSSGGRLLVKTTNNPDKSITLQVVNDPGAPSPWGSPPSSLAYTMQLKGTF